MAKSKTAKPEAPAKRISNLDEFLSRKKSYDDSLSTYNDSMTNHAKLISIGMQKTNSTKPTKDEVDEMLYEGGSANTFSHNYTNSATGKPESKKAKLVQKTSSKIAPVKSNTYTGKASVDKDGVSYQQEVTVPIYKAPTQRIEFEDTSLQRQVTPSPQAKKEVVEKAKTKAYQSLPGYKKVDSSDPKYKNQREYSKFVKDNGPAKDDAFKKATIEARKKILNKNSAKVLPKKNNTAG